MSVLKSGRRGSQKQAKAEPAAAHSVSQPSHVTRSCSREVEPHKYPDSSAVVVDVKDSGALVKSGAGPTPSVKEPSSKIDTQRDDDSSSEPSGENETHVDVDNNNCEATAVSSSKKQRKVKYFKWRDPKVFIAMIMGMLKMEPDVMLLDTAACKKAFEIEMLPHGGAPVNASLDTFRRALVAVQNTAQEIFETRLTMRALLDKCKTETERQALMNSHTWIVLRDRIRDLMVAEVYYKTDTYDPLLEERIYTYAEKLNRAKQVKLGFSTAKKVSLQQRELKGGILLDCATMGGSVRKAKGAFKVEASSVDSDESEAEGQLDDNNEVEHLRKPTGKSQKKRKARGWTSESEAEHQLEDDEDGDEQEDQPKKKKKKNTARGQTSDDDRPMDRAKRLSLLNNGSKPGIDLGSAQKRMDEAVLQPFVPNAELNHQMVGVSTTLVTFTGKFDKIEGKFDKIEGKFDKIEGKFEAIDLRFDNLESNMLNMGKGIIKQIEMLASKITT